jgi:hypothetical protein
MAWAPVQRLKTGCKRLSVVSRKARKRGLSVRIPWRLTVSRALIWLNPGYAPRVVSASAISSGSTARNSSTWAIVMPNVSSISSVMAPLFPLK